MRVYGLSQQNHLENVWYVPKIGRNLFSIGQTMKKGFVFSASQDGCVFKKDGIVKLMGKRNHKGLFVLAMQVCLPVIAAEVHIASSKESLQMWHERLCHQNKRHVQKVLKRKGIEIQCEEDFCDGCVLGKHQRKSFGTRTNRPVTTGALIHADVCGPMQEESLGGAKYFLCFKDDFSKFRRVFFLKTKTEVSDCLKTFINETKTVGHTIKEFLCDGGKEFDNSSVRNILELNGINLRVIMPYTHEQSGVAERENRTLVECARSMIHTKDLPLKLWAEAVNSVAYVLNRTGATSIEGKTPAELWFERDGININHLRIFGA